jgi:hypothetical protein
MILQAITPEGNVVAEKPVSRAECHDTALLREHMAGWAERILGRYRISPDAASACGFAARGTGSGMGKYRIIAARIKVAN